MAKLKDSEGIPVVGKGSWKKPRSWKVLSFCLSLKEPCEVGKNRVKERTELERTEEGKFRCSWKV